MRFCSEALVGHPCSGAAILGLHAWGGCSSQTANPLANVTSQQIAKKDLRGGSHVAFTTQEGNPATARCGQMQALDQTLTLRDDRSVLLSLPACRTFANFHNSMELQRDQHLLNSNFDPLWDWPKYNAAVLLNAEPIMPVRPRGAARASRKERVNVATEVAVLSMLRCSGETWQ
eukprot:6465561-Amphidinium_carterae.1